MKSQSHRFTNEKLLEILSLSQNATAIYTGEESIIQSANDVMIGFWGKDRSVIGKPLGEAVPELAGQPFLDLLKQVWLTGVTHESKDAVTQLLVDGKLQTFYFDFIYRAIKDQNGEIDCILHTATDVTELNLGRNMIAHAKEQQEALNREQVLNEELGAANEELAAALEELSATNEELQQTQESLQVLNRDLEIRVEERTKKIIDLNQELEAFNEELRASNEELVSTNEELSESRMHLERSLDALAASNYRTQSIIESAPFPIGVYTGRNMRITFVNKSIMDVWGKGYNVVGKLYSEVLPELDNQEVYAQLDAVFTTGISFEARNQRIDLVVNGKMTIFYFNYNFTALRNESGEIYGVMNTAADVTDVVLSKLQLEKSATELDLLNKEFANINEELAAVNEELTASNEEQALINDQLTILNDKLKVSQDELNLAIDAAGMATFDLNPITGKFKGNDLIKSWFGLQPEDEIELQKATDVIAEADRDRVVAAIQNALNADSGGNYDSHYSIVNPHTQEVKTVRAKGKALFNDKQEAVRLSGVLQDVTEQMKDEQRKNDFIAMVSHELKTPLTSLTAYIQILQAKAKSNGDNFAAGALEKASNQTKKMTTMINGFLNVSRLESGKIHIENQHFDMALLVAEIEGETILTVSSHTVIFAPVEETFVNADRDKIGQVINNFLSNAVKYSPAGSTINVACTTVNNQAQISVRDQGNGIKPEDQQKLFERYYRVKDQPVNIAGFGIGLYLCAEVIQRHHGKIWVESKIGEGSTFSFSLPM
ncbi:ATP-binding protein [Pedobacter duraquae]|uniref:histidine kinase n=1 Tax=Pedobacter duraquae TaxID=425511 RepID=A0A4R6IQ74_9SPHI|nr:ATP-binding protein [Pedobacter duraquae]TDO24472.1 PAS domain-containing protein [Pedobacter duraquae]